MQFDLKNCISQSSMLTKQLLLSKSYWIMGWMSQKELFSLADIASELKDNSIIYEIGSFCGRSTRAIADNSPRNSTIYCIDPWKFEISLIDGEFIQIDRTTFDQFYINLYDHIMSGKVFPIISTWEDYNLIEKADFIFIDGDHTYEAARRDITKAIKYIKDDGIIAGHDYPNFPGVYRAVNELFPDGIFVKDTIWCSKRF